MKMKRYEEIDEYTRRFLAAKKCSDFARDRFFETEDGAERNVYAQVCRFSGELFRQYLNILIEAYDDIAEADENE